jgi:hypothetical protein
MNKRLTQLKSSTAGPIGGSQKQPMIIEQPLVIMFAHEQQIICHIHPRKDDGPPAYGLLICDLVRHVANAFKVHEDEIWAWVDAERENPTDQVRPVS